MDFIKRMKKREFIEMGLKTLAAVLAAFIAIILMEGMIYSIKLNAYVEKSTHASYVPAETEAYCIKKGEDKYVVLFHNIGDSIDIDWSADSGTTLTKAECENLPVKEIYFHAPNAFIFSITPVHYVVMILFVGVISGYFVYRFVKLSKEYKKVEETFEKTGTIEIKNM